MSGEVASKVARKILGGASQKSVGLVIADCANNDGTGIYISQANIAARSEVHDRTVRRVLKEFEASGLIIHVGWRTFPSGARVKEYDIDLDVLKTFDDIKIVSITKNKNRARLDKLSTPDFSEADKLSSPEKGEADTVSNRSGHCVQSKRTPRPTNLPKPSLTVPSLEGGEDFVSFWNAYPFTLGQNRNACKRVWDGLSGQDQSKIIACLPAYVRIMGTQELSYPFNFLNDGVWQDVAEVPASVVQADIPPPYPAGTREADLFALVMEKHGAPKAWAWFGPTKLSVDDGGTRLVAPSAFVRSTWTQQFSPVIEAAGFEVSNLIQAIDTRDAA